MISSLCIDGARIILKWIPRTWHGKGTHGLDWSGSGQGDVASFVNAVMKLRAP